MGRAHRVEEEHEAIVQAIRARDSAAAAAAMRKHLGKAQKRLIQSDGKSDELSGERSK